ncbi:MAG: DNA sulfur modification protein DndE [Eubacterium sp.]|nr:DNA sulfur modification protein DndE [Eubacterium sp.]
MIVRQIRLSNHAKERLSRLKGKTGIKNWNVLCRWAYCYSLKENTIPTPENIDGDSNVEMSWYTFAGEYSDLYEALIIAWCKKMDIPTDNETMAKYIKMHIERGISYLSGTNFIRELDDLLRLGAAG